MSQAAVGTIPCTFVRISIPRNGVWVADCDVVVDNTDGNQTAAGLPVPKKGEPAQVSVDASSLQGTVLTSDLSIYGRARLRIIGGNGGLGAPVSAKNYGAGPTVSLVLADALTSNGELPLDVANSNSTFVNAHIQSWQMFGDRTLAQNLTRLASMLGCVWRVTLQTGAVVFTQDTFQTQATLPTDATASASSFGNQLTYECPMLDQLPLPGQVLNGLLIQEVIINVLGSRLLVVLCAQQTSTLINRPTDAELYGSFSATVESQNPDGTLQLSADDPRLAGTGLQFVRTFPGAGITQTVAPGTRVQFIYQNGNAALPLVVSFDGTSPQTVQLNAEGMVTLSDGQDFVALAKAVLSNFQAIATAAAATPAGPSEPGFKAFAAALAVPSFPASVAATKVKGS